MSKNKTVFITGGTGLLGQELIKTAPKVNCLFASYYKNTLVLKAKNCQFVPLDIANKKSVSAMTEKLKPGVIIHTASLGSVDYCEEHPKEAAKVNILGTRNLLEAAKEFGSKFIFTSSNAVFDGENPPYKETDTPNPLNLYGKTKLEVEKLLEKSGLSYAIVRLITMYGWNNPNERLNPVTWIVKKLKNSEPIKMVDDVFNNHLFVGQAAKAIWKTVVSKRNSLYHIAGRDVISRHDLAIRTAEIFGLDKNLISKVSSDFFSSLAPRPKNTSYDTTKMEKELKIKPVGIVEGLTYMRSHPPGEYRELK